MVRMKGCPGMGGEKWISGSDSDLRIDDKDVAVKHLSSMPLAPPRMGMYK